MQNANLVQSGAGSHGDELQGEASTINETYLNVRRVRSVSFDVEERPAPTLHLIPICYHSGMLKSLSFRKRVQKTLLDSGVTGQIDAHPASINRQSLQRLIAADPYVTFSIKLVHDAVAKKAFKLPELEGIMAASLGISLERFREPGPGFIDPVLSAARLRTMLTAISDCIEQPGAILLATSHPGSLTTHYQRLAAYITRCGGTLAGALEPFKIADYRWIDSLDGVHVLTDEGQLLHTHEADGFHRFIASLPQPPSLVIADHGYAGAAINHGIRTVAIHDVDDPGVPVAAHLGANVLAIPMNDNQLNQPTAAVIEAVIAEYEAA